MSASLYLLRTFFQTGRNHHGGYMGEHEDMVNATERNLSLHTDDELIALRESARLFGEYCDKELHARIADDAEPCTDCGAVGDHHCPAWCDIPYCERCFPSAGDGGRP